MGKLIQGKICEICDEYFTVEFNTLNKTFEDRMLCDRCKRKLKFFVTHGDGCKCKDDNEGE